MMLSKLQRRGLAFVLAFAMTFSLVPVTGFATEEETEPVTAETTVPETEPVVETTAATEAVAEPTVETKAATEPEEVYEIEPVTATVPVDNSAVEAEAAEETESPEVSPVDQIQSRIQAILTQYGVAAEMTDNEIAAAIAAVDGDTLKATMDEMDAIEQDASELTEEEFLSIDAEITETYGRFCDVMNQLFSPLAIASVNVLDGQVSVTDDKNKCTASGGTVTVKATGGWSAQTNNITITNETSSAATLEFDFSVSNHNTFTIGGEDKGSSGTYTILLSAGGTLSLLLKSKTAFTSTTATLTLSNFSLTAAAATADVTFEYDSSLGSITVGGNEVSSGDTVPGINPAAGTSVIATPNSGNFFLGWINTETNKVELSDASGTLKPSNDMIVRAVFVPAASNAWFLAGGDHLYDDLNTAVAYANTATNKTVVLMNNATLPADDYTIPDGVTLVIPFDDSSAPITDNPEDYLKHAYDEPSSPRTQYRQLTMASGAEITVKSGGKISIDSMIADQFLGQIGSYGAIYMNEGSNITVQGGGFLYVWGYIFYGDEVGGTVSIESGGTVYEPISIMDYPGSSSLTDDLKSAKVFPMRAYTIRNVEVPMILDSGAVEYAFYCLWGNRIGTHPGLVLLFADAAIGNYTPAFQFGSGTKLVKSYSDGIQQITVYNGVSLNALSVIIDVSWIGSNITFSTSETSGLPLPSGWDVNLLSGKLTLNDNVIMTEGSKLTITEGATVDTNGKNVYVLDATDDVGAVSQINGCSIYVQDVHGKYYTCVPTDAVLDVNGTLIASGGFYTSNNNAAIISSEGTGVIEVTTASASTEIKVKDNNNASQTIEVGPAQLKNADVDGVESYLSTADANKTTYRYSAQCGKWYAGEHTITSSITSEPTSASLGSAMFTCSCGHSYEVPVHVKLQAIEASADAEIQMRLKFLIPDSLIDRISASISKTTIWPAGQKVTPKEYTSSELVKDAKGRYVFYMGAASGEMTSPITIQFSEGGNTLNIYDYADKQVKQVVTRSVADYIKLARANGTDAQKALVESMATYGAYAQYFFGTNADKLVHEEIGFALPDISGVTADTITYQVLTTGDNIGLTQTTQNAILDSAIALNVNFQPDEGATIDDYTFSLELPSGSSMALTPTPHPEISGIHYVKIPDIPAAFLDHRYEITVTQTATGKTNVITTSVLAYLRNVLASSGEKEASPEQKNQARAMYLYNQQANAFFGK